MNKDYLTDIEVVKIEAFMADEIMAQAVKKVLLQYIYSSGVIKKGENVSPLKNRALALVGADVSNEELGSHLRALWEGVQALEKGFDDLSTIKSNVESPYQEENIAI